MFALDPGARWGLAIGAHTLETLHASTGDLGAYLATLPRPDVVVIEDPIQQVIGIAGHGGGVTQLRRYRDQRDAVIRLWGLGVVRDVAVLTWQAVHGGYVEADPKQRSLAVLVANRTRVDVLAGCRRGRGVDGEKVDAGAMWWWARQTYKGVNP